MAIAINRVLLVGNLTRDPEETATGGRVIIANFSVACNNRAKIEEEWRDRPDFFDCVAYGTQAENILQYLKKGSPVAIDGRLRQDRWTAQGGEKRSKVVVVAASVEFTGKGSGGGERHQAGDDSSDWYSGAGEHQVPAAGEPVEVGASQPTDDEIPF